MRSANQIITVLIFTLQFAITDDSIGQCTTSNVTINTQDSLDNFVALHSNCDSIFGDLTLTGSDIIDISGLNFINHISGTLRVGASNLPSLEGLENITSIGHSLRIENIKPISNLAGISGYLIKRIPGDIIIRNNRDLVSISALRGITRANDISIFNNDRLQSLHGLQSIDSITRTLFIDDNDSLVNLLGIDSLVFVGINLTISDNALLTDCSLACQYIDSDIVQNNVSFQRNPSPCQTTTEVKIYCQPTLCPEEDFILTTQTEVDAFISTYGNCDTVTGNLTIDGNITNLNGLGFIKVVTEDLYIRDNNIVDSLFFLENIVHVGGDLLIQNMDNLKGLYGFPGNSLTSINGNFTIRDHALLENIDDLDGITEVQGELLIRANPSLTSINGLNKLTYVQNNLFLSTNSTLPSLQGLENVNKVDGALIIANHPLLFDCNAICLLVSADGVAGNISMNNNPFPCNGAANLEANCTPPPCIIGSVTISSQEDLDTFAMENAGCDTLFGNIILQGGISDLSPLSFVRLLTGSLTIRNTDNLSGLSGLVDMTVQSDFAILNTGMTSLLGFDQFTLLRDIQISNNNDLVSLSAMLGLTMVEHTLSISENNLLADLSGLDSLNNIGHNLSITNQDNLIDISALSNLSLIGIDLRIQSNAVLSDCSGICQIIDGTVVQRNIFISANLEDCNSIKEVQLACTASDCDGRDITITSPVTSIDTTNATHSISSGITISGNATWRAGFQFDLENGFEVADMGLLQLLIIDRCDE